MMQIVQDVTSPEFGRLLGKKLVLSRPYLYLIGLLGLLWRRRGRGEEVWGGVRGEVVISLYFSLYLNIFISSYHHTLIS